MDLTHLMWQGPAIDDPAMMDRLPDDLRALLERINGFIAFGGGLHIRGACREPIWHSLRTAWDSSDAFHRHYRTIRDTDVPFGQDAVGDQFLLRDDEVVKLSAESDDVESLGVALWEFLQNVQDDPVEFLALQPLQNHLELGGELAPGQLLSVQPPFVLDARNTKISYRSTAAMDRLTFLADLAQQIRSIPDGQQVTLSLTGVLQHSEPRHSRESHD